MKSIRLILVVALCILLGALFGSPLSVSAQDDTPTLEPTLEATPVPTPVVTPDPVQVVRDGSTTISEFIIGVITGALVGGGGVLVAFSRVLRFVNQNDALKIAIERLFLSAPVETQQRVRAGVVTAKEAADLANELTDGKISYPVTVNETHG